MTETLSSAPASERPWRTIAAWTCAAAWGGWALVRLTGADRIPGLDLVLVPLISLTPYAAAVSPLPVVAALLLRRPRAAAVATLAVAGLLSAVLPRQFGGGQPAAAGPTARIVSANLQFGLGDPETLVRLVRDSKADVLSVQEFTPDARSGLQEAGLQTELPYEVLAPVWGAEGTGIYSRHPLTILPPLPGTTMAQPRAALTLGESKIEFTAVHPLPPISSTNSRDWRHVLSTLPAPRRAGPVQILAGDFNATFDHARFRALLGRGYADAADRRGQGLDPTWGVTQHGPPLTLDHILVSEAVAVRSYTVHDLPRSDHRAIVAELQLP
ncbi:MAG: endonuclease/exonuclease/phosphatase family protein [Streptosporangiaceae bacterium]